MLSEILFETDGGTPLDAMQRYEPISLRESFVSFSTSPPYDVTKFSKNEMKEKGKKKTMRIREKNNVNVTFYNIQPIPYRYTYCVVRIVLEFWESNKF